jgi:hypothetical protein
LAAQLTQTEVVLVVPVVDLLEMAAAVAARVETQLALQMPAAAAAQAATLAKVATVAPAMMRLEHWQNRDKAVAAAAAGAPVVMTLVGQAAVWDYSEKAPADLVEQTPVATALVDLVARVEVTRAMQSSRPREAFMTRLTYRRRGFLVAAAVAPTIQLQNKPTAAAAVLLLNIRQ